MAKIADMEVDVQLALDSLNMSEQKAFITNNLSVCDVDDLISEVVYRGSMDDLIKEVARRCDIEEVIDSFKQDEIMEWLDNCAEEYGYTKLE